MRMWKHWFFAANYWSLAHAFYKKNKLRMHSVALAALLATTLLAMTARAVMNYHSDDNHFAMGAQLVADGYTPYVDFSYFQMPYASFIFGAVLKAQLSAYKYLTLRLTNLVFCLASIALIYIICSNVARSKRVAIACVLLYASSEFLNLAAEQLNSYAIANFFGILAFATLIATVGSPASRAFFSGICLGAAMASKLYYALLIPIILVCAIAITQPLERRMVLQTALACLTGLAFALSPVALIAAIDPEAFWFDNYGYHILNSKYRELSQSGEGMTFPAKLKFITQMFSKPVFLATGVLGLILFSFAYRHGTARCINGTRLDNRIFFVTLGSFASMLAAAIVPRPLWPSYFLAPLPFAIIALACLYGIGQKTEGFRRLSWDRHVINVAAFVALLSFPTNLHLLRKATSIDAWSTVTVHQQGHRIRNIMTEHGRIENLLAFEGLYAIEAGLPFYRQIAGTTFAYRVGDLMDDNLRVRRNIIYKGNINQVLQTKPPLGILVSSRFDKFNSESLKYATTNNYREIDIQMPDHRFFVSVPKRD